MRDGSDEVVRGTGAIAGATAWWHRSRHQSRLEDCGVDGAHPEEDLSGADTPGPVRETHNLPPRRAEVDADNVHLHGYRFPTRVRRRIRDGDRIHGRRERGLCRFCEEPFAARMHL